MNYLVWGIVAFLVALLISLILGPGIIKKLHEAKYGQEIREEGPSWHKAKSGTPTMGGFIFFVGLIPASIFVILFSRTFDLTFLLVLMAACLFGLIGYADDYIKVIKKRNLGLRAKEKFMAQLLVSAIFALLLYYKNGGEVFLFWDTYNWSYFVIPLNIFIMLAITNAVNLTDGVDGLAGSTSFFAIGFLAFAAFMAKEEALYSLAIASMGGILGFLSFNRHPAKVFMGDTGSLFLGGLIGALALSMGIQFILILIGLVFFIETLSVIIQVTYFKITKGKRIFLMTPIHHHFEKKGWSEVKIVVVASAVTIVMGIISGFLIV